MGWQWLIILIRWANHSPYSIMSLEWIERPHLKYNLQVNSTTMCFYQEKKPKKKSNPHQHDQEVVSAVMGIQVYDVLAASELFGLKKFGTLYTFLSLANPARPLVCSVSTNMKQRSNINPITHLCEMQSQNLQAFLVFMNTCSLVTFKVMSGLWFLLFKVWGS